MSSNIVMKLSFKPAGSEAHAGNVAHLRYIGTRPGVDTEVTDAALERAELSDLSDDEDYLRYIGERPGVVRETAEGPVLHGLFGASGVADVSRVRQEIGGLELSPAYRMILSVREETAAAVGLTDKAAWEILVCEQAPTFARGLGIPLQRLGWVAALHQAAGHPHVHLIAWDRADKPRGRDVVEKQALVAMREELTRELWRPVTTELGAEKGGIRDALVRGTRTELAVLTDLMGWERGTGAPLLDRPATLPMRSAEDLTAIAAGLEEVASTLPGHGRLVLAYMPTETKDAVSRVVDLLLDDPASREAADRFTAIAAELAGHQAPAPEKVEAAADRASADLGRRVGQNVLVAAEGLVQDRLHERACRAAPVLLSRGADPALCLSDRIRAARACGTLGVSETSVVDSATNRHAGPDGRTVIAAAWGEGAARERLDAGDVEALERATGGDRPAPVMAGLGTAARLARQVYRDLDCAHADSRSIVRARRARVRPRDRGIWHDAEPGHDRA
ncbi:MAG: MobP3 family relaxase [Coriobacteriia bacterium]|nr:MobP3 family relaxase [Coriobacteriia bacterium]